MPSDVRHLVLGTAGHIDHGKSALVHALTGTDPDRLKEEKRRGITIELGFADLDLGDEGVLSFVDVPGHERFVRHMVAGATGIDAVLLVVAADQGIQPQTREHLDICSLLGVERGVVALSKCDLVEPELVEVVALELRELLDGTFLGRAPIVHASARTGVGLEELRRELAGLLGGHAPRSATGVPRLPVDRSFVLKGFGTVVTGTLVSGRLVEGDEVEVLPGGRRGRIRGLQVHRHKLPVAEAGRRTAVNLQGLDCDDVPRGAALTRPGALLTTRRAWARLTLLPSAPKSLRRGGPVRFHQGTCDRPARLRVLSAIDDTTLRVELYLGEEAVLAPGDRFILRRPAPVDTVAGGVVVDVRPPLPRLATPACFEAAALAPASALQLRLERAATSGREPAELAAELGETRALLDEVADGLAGEKALARGGGRWFAAAAWNRAAERAQVLVSDHHLAQPLHPGISREALRAGVCPDMPQEAWRELLADLEQRGDVRLDGESVARADHRVVLGEEEQALADRIGERFRRAGLDPPELSEVIPAGQRERAGPIVEWLISRGELVRVQNRGLFHGEALQALRAKLREYAARSKTIDVASFKRLAGVTRKNAIPLLEYLDGERVTCRVGDVREILDRGR
jgi:selenocysteine-specific elongation factor